MSVTWTRTCGYTMTHEPGRIRQDEEGERIELVFWFAQHMLAKLRKNADKGDWNTEFMMLHRRMVSEALELSFAIQEYCKGTTSGVTQYNLALLDDIIEEAADTANFAAFIADKARRYKEQINP